MVWHRRLMIIGVMCTLGVLESQPTLAQGWQTGTGLKKKLQTIASVSWSGQELGTALSSLSAEHRVAVVLDRRVNPQQQLELSLRDYPLEQLFEQLARHRELGFSMFGPVGYIGPAETAAKLRTLAELRREELRNLPPSPARNNAARSQVLRWPQLAEPRELIREEIEDAGYRAVGLEQVPHDLWAEASWPSMMLTDRLTLLLAQFGLTFAVSPDGKSIGLEPIPDDVWIQRSYPAGNDAAAQIERWRGELPDAKFALADGKVHVQGTVEVHERLSGATSRQATRPVDLSQRRFTLRVENKQLGEVTAYLTKELGLQFQFDQQSLADAGVTLESLISFQVRNATVDQVLKVMLDPAGLTFERRELQVKIKGK